MFIIMFSQYVKEVSGPVERFKKKENPSIRRVVKTPALLSHPFFAE